MTPPQHRGRRWRRRAAFTASLVLALALAGRHVSRATTYQAFGGLHARADTSSRLVAITFDDGPSVDNTTAVLEVLRRHHAKATFFMVGANIAAHPEVAAAVAADGHEGANHSYSHRRMVLVTPGFVRREVEETDRLLRSAGFEGELLFRPPYGKKLLVLPYVLRRMGKKTITWDADSHDTETQDAPALTRHVLDAVAPGSIVIFHDGGAPKPGTIEALDQVLAALSAKGFSFVTVSQLLAAGA
jgi:peptidoglycan/xylan/chitin deacetylase (PgdA/CDA1 family)